MIDKMTFLSQFNIQVMAYIKRDLEMLVTLTQSISNVHALMNKNLTKDFLNVLKYIKKGVQ